MDQRDEKDIISAITKISRNAMHITLVIVCCITILLISLVGSPPPKSKPANITDAVKTPVSKVNTGLASRSVPPDAWLAPDINIIPHGNEGTVIRYGRELIVSTAKYLGPQGSIAHLTNGMNCQNCHLNAGTKLFSNNFSGFISTYPKYNPRNGKVDQPAQRIADCFERSLNGTVPDINKKEVQAMLAYLKWVGKNAEKARPAFGLAVEKLSFMGHPADPLKGRVVFAQKCQSCHGKNGEGVLAADKITYTYPPLWGAHSYNDGAGMYRLTKFAGFVKNNMPFGATYQNPQLTDEEAWNVAAFVNSQPRPHRDQRHDFPDLRQKPFDFPFGPYTDNFDEKQHKYGTFGPILATQKTPPQ